MTDTEGGRLKGHKQDKQCDGSKKPCFLGGGNGGNHAEANLRKAEERGTEGLAQAEAQVKTQAEGRAGVHREHQSWSLTRSNVL